MIRERAKITIDTYPRR